MITPQIQAKWKDWFRQRKEVPYFTNAQNGQGVIAVSKATQVAGMAVNKRRYDRGMLPRPIRAVVIGFPNVGKSALINRLLGQKVVESAARPGVTRQLRWVKISKELELLDAPGIIPTKLEDQGAALKLAICDDIGEASYDNQLIAAGLVDILTYLQEVANELLPKSPLRERYGLDTSDDTGEAYLHSLAEYRYQGDLERTARQLITDYRKSYLGNIPLELP
ncbi:50S ribosomal subunit maturation GTPase RbgA (B. subtilis YlqF) [Richelia intracellularis HH01]|uniref:50S ribosomal subunit maturation GTPase RbgA (B. subtilis YlqF) n=1 Tax=Richelia intracellularis HH01 TaxID=1165094 RepID=M1X382_9NOST|nr:50S ribosomal subunit maturation GTPase RbgA (B. subtilis YlqF) [Richelia intracellularis HH01]